jgi:hypothetical protein
MGTISVESGFVFWQAQIFFSSARPRSHPASYPQIVGAWSPELKHLRYKANHSPPPNIEIRNMWRCNSIPPNIFKVQCLNKQRDNFYTTPTTSDSRHVTHARYLFVPELLNTYVVLLVRNICLCVKI